jgi:hypothetical protein
VQTLFLFLFVKVLLRDWRVLSIWDISYAVVSSLVSGWIFSVIGQYAALPLLGLVVLFTWWHTHSFSESLFVSLQVIIWSIVVDHISSLLTYMLKLDDGYLLIFYGITAGWFNHIESDFNEYAYPDDIQSSQTEPGYGLAATRHLFIHHCQRGTRQ